MQSDLADLHRADPPVSLDAVASPRPAPGPLWAGGRVPSLDGLRAFSIALVLIGHLNSGRPLNDHPLWARLALSVFGNGAFGVQVFFVISGFLITHLLVKEHGRRGTIDLKHFYVRRIFRICPAYYTLIAVVAGLSWVGILNATKRDVGHAATFTWIYNFGVWNWSLAHTWSLSVEEQFYLFWPVTLLLVGVKRVLWLAIFIIVLVPGGRAVFPLDTPKVVHRLCYVLMAGHFDVLMFGCVAALLWPSGAFQSTLRRRATPWACAALALAAIATAAVREQNPTLNDHVVFAGCADTVIGLGICAGMIGVVSRPRSAIGRCLNWRVIAWIGTLSYSIYLWQQLFLTPSPLYLVQKWPVNLALAVAAGVTSFYLIERPMVRLRVQAFRDPAGSGPAL